MTDSKLYEVSEASKKVWLEDNGFTLDDVMVDEVGNEYVVRIVEDGTPSEEGYGFTKERIYLADIINPL